MKITGQAGCETLKIPKIVTGLTGEIKKIGPAKYSLCILCDSQKPLYIVEKYITPRVLYLPTLRIRSSFVAICPSCHGKMLLDPAVGKKVRHHPETLILPRNLSEYKENPLFQWNVK